MKITLLTLIILSSSVLSALTVVPSKINYQGLITGTGGSPIVSATNTITAHLYGTESGGTALHSESFVNVNSDTNGIYSIEIGNIGLQSILEGNSELWLELIINQQTLSPRQKINSVPYALVAKAAESIVPGSDADAAISTNASAISALQGEIGLNPAKELVQYGFEENLFLSETSSESSSGGFNYADSTHFISGTPASNLDVSDRLLLVAQNLAYQNGIYTVLHKEYGNAYIIRADDFNSEEDVSLGIFTVIEKGVLSGEGFVLDQIAENFTLDNETNGTLGFSKFTNSALETRLDSLESESSAWVNNYNLIFNNTEQISNNETAISTLQADVDQNETDADAAVANLQLQIDENTSVMFAKYAVTESVNSFVTFYNSVYNYADYITTTLPTNNFDLGDTILFTNLGSYKNGLYDVVYKSSDYLGLNRVENLNESSEFSEGHIVLITEGNNAAAGFFLNPVGDDFVLDSTFVYENSDISYSQFTVNLNQDTDFEGRLTAGELTVNGLNGWVSFNGLSNNISGNLTVAGNYVNFENVDNVMVPTPDQSNEATNKAYVDAVVATNASAITAEATTRTSEIVALQINIDRNESDAVAAIAAEATTARTAEQVNASAIAALQSDVDQNDSDADTAIANLQNQLDLNPARGLIDFAFELPINLEPAPPSSGASYNLGPPPSTSGASYGSYNIYNFEIEDKILLTAQSDASENGVYEIVFSEFGQVYLDRANDFDSEEELTLGIFVFVESPSYVTGYVLDQRPANFVLDDPSYGAIGFSRFTVDTSENVNFSQGINADNISGNFIGAWNATIWEDMAVYNDFQAGGNTTLMNTSIGGTLSVGSDTSLDNLTGNGVINFAGASSVVVPDPTISEEVANKNYVDDFVNTSIASDNAKGLVQLAVTENVSNISEYYLTYESGGSTLNPAQGDLVLLTGQTTNSENGIYEVISVNLSSSYSSLPSSSGSSSSSSSSGSSSSSSSGGPAASDYYVNLTRASNFDSADEFTTGSIVFVEKGVQVGQGYVLGELASNFTLGTSALNYIQFTVDTTSDVAFDQSVSASSLSSSGDLSVSGNSTLSGQISVTGSATMSNGLSVSGGLDAQTVDAQTVDAYIVDVQTVDAQTVDAQTVDAQTVDAQTVVAQTVGAQELLVGGTADFSSASSVTVPEPSADSEAATKQYVDNATTTEAEARTTAIIAATTGDISANSLQSSGNLSVSGITDLGNVEIANLSASGGITISETANLQSGLVVPSGAADFSSASSVTVPEPSADNQAATKLYVDAALDTVNAPGLVKLAFTSNVDLTGTAKEQQSVTLVAGDLVLLTGQESSSENGMYAVGSLSGSESSVTLTRASSLDSAEDFASGSFVFVENGTQAGQGYVLEELASEFTLGSSPISYSHIGVSASSLSSSGDLSVSGNSTFSGISVTGPATMSNGLSVSGITDLGNVEIANLSASGGITISETANLQSGLVVPSGTADFSSASSVTVPEPSADSEAATKQYVDNATTTEAEARTTAIIAATTGDISANSLQSSGNLSVSGTTSLSDVSASGNATFASLSTSSLSATSGSATLDSLNVMGSATLGPDVTIDSSGFRVMNSDEEETSYIGRSPYTGDYGNRLVGTTIIDDLTVNSGSATLDFLNVMGGPASPVALNVYGMAIVSRLDVMDGIFVNSNASEYSHIGKNPITGEYGNRLVGSTIIDDLSVSGAADFSSASSVTVPEPSADNQASTKQYVDNATTTEAEARTTAIIAATTGDISANSLQSSGNLSVSGTTNLGSVSASGLDVSGTTSLSDVSASGNATFASLSTSSLSATSGSATLDSLNVMGSATLGPDVTIDSSGFRVMNSDEEETSYIGRSPYTGDYGNRLVGTTIIDDLTVNSGSATLDFLNVMGGPASPVALNVYGMAIVSRLDVMDGIFVNSNASEYSHIGKNPITGEYGNRLVGSTIIDDLSVSGGSATLASLNVGGSATFNGINVGGSVDVLGDATFNGTVTINSGELIGVTSLLMDSDYRFKDNIKTITGAIDKVKQLRGVEYTLKSNGKDSVGVIAQEVEKVYPQLVHTGDERLGVTDAKAVNYSSLIGVLIEAIKEQQTQIEDLKAQVNVLNESTNNQTTNTFLATFDTQQ